MLQQFVPIWNIMILMFYVQSSKEESSCPKITGKMKNQLMLQIVRKILLSCNNRRLKAALLFLASGGMRETEAFSIRNMDIDFNTKPTKSQDKT